MSELLRGEDISFSYGGERALRDPALRDPALRNVAISLDEGKIVAVVGPNGSGKSTLLKSLLGQVAATGSIRWNGREIAHWRPRELARLLAYLPQNPTWLNGQSVGSALAMGRAAYWGRLGLESREDEQAVDAVARQLGLTELLARRMDELSGGQRQMALLGRCLVQSPRAMLLDEPDTFLDLRNQSELCERLGGAARDRKIGILMATHDLNLAARFADSVVVLGAGRVARAGRPEDVLTVELLEAVYGVGMERIDREGARPVLLPK